MMKNEKDLDRLIVDTMRDKKPSNLKELVRSIKNEENISERDIQEGIKNLVQKGRILFEDANHQPIGFLDFLSSRESLRFWFPTVLSFGTLTVIFLVPEASPFAPLRWLLGLLFCLYLPGYSLIYALFPKKEIDVVERIVLNVCLSLALLPVLGLFVNFTVGNILTLPVTITVHLFTLFSTFLACLRRYLQKFAQVNENMKQ